MMQGTYDILCPLIPEKTGLHHIHMTVVSFLHIHRLQLFNTKYMNSLYPTTNFQNHHDAVLGVLHHDVLWRSAYYIITAVMKYL